MENRLENFIDYNPHKNDAFKNQKRNNLLNARGFYKGRREILIAFEENIFPLPKPYVFAKDKWKERDLGNKTFMPELFKLNFLEQYNRTPFFEKESELLNRDFGYESIDKLSDAFNNTKTNKERDELFDKINNKLGALKKLVKIVSDTTEKKEQIM